MYEKEKEFGLTDTNKYEMYFLTICGDGFTVIGTKKDLKLLEETVSKRNRELFPSGLGKNKIKDLAKDMGLEVKDD